MKLVKPSRKLIYSLVVLALCGWLVIPFTRQLTFGPKIEGIPLCRLQDDLRKSALGGEYRPGFLDRIGQYLRLDEPANALNLISDNGRRHVYLSMVDVDDRKVRRHVLSAMQLHLSSPDVLAVLIRARDDPDGQCRMIAADGILRFSDDDSLKSNTFEKAFNDPDKIVRSAAHRYLCEQMDDAMVLRFVPRIVEPVDPKIRPSVVSRIWRVRTTSENVESLTLMLKDSHSQWRAVAACALDRLGKRDAMTLAVIRSALQNKQDEVGETLSFIALSSSLAKELFPEIVLAASNSTDNFSRSYAIQALGQCGAEGVPYLVHLLEVADARLQVNCIYALANIGKDARQAIPDLRALLKDSRVEVRRSVNHALARIDPKFVAQEQFEPLPMMTFGSPAIKE